MFGTIVDACHSVATLEAAMNRPGFGEDQSHYDAGRNGLASIGYAHLKVDSAGRIVIPADMRAAMLVDRGDTVTASVVNGELRIISRGVALKRVQASAREWRDRNPDAGSVVDELIAERREEAKQEDLRYERLAREADELSPEKSK
jgi:bifunctional DNA-binding transcriptional regulator/antitoxin component of YhaV-PrlF toxin-antitoxin module